MDPSNKKFYGVHDADAKAQYKQYFSAYTPYAVMKESTIDLMDVTYKAFSAGQITGRTMIDFSISPTISHLLVIKDFVPEITVVNMNRSSVKEVEKWKNNDKDAFNWSHVVGILKEIKGNRFYRDESEDEEENLRGKLKNIIHLENYKDKDSLPLPKVDIATSIWFLEAISKDHDEYRTNLRKLCKVINLGGYLLLYAFANCSYFKVGEDKFHVLSADEIFIRMVLSEEGFNIQYFQSFDRAMTVDSSDHEGMFFIIACKVKEPQEIS